MNERVIYAVRCDHPSCITWFERTAGAPISSIEEIVPASWWAQFVTGDDGQRRLAIFCPEHEPVPAEKGNA